MRKAWVFSLVAMLACLNFGCNEELKDPDKVEIYKGPLVENHDIIMLFSDSARLQIKLKAPVQQEFDNGDGVFPKGLYVEFYGEPGQITSTLKANYGKNDKRKNLYIARGNVIVENLQKKEKLETEELYWDKNKGKIYTDKFVRITTAEEILTGEGLRANQDFTNWRILKPTGIINLKEE
ncbi:LPS export ABC transporter periplasmic protein LptC [Pontibacter sp. 172403-2]|uniref:LPS export ABC transporter periplasmic protein LptC n=1 Tax=Pontibacter rufus TaxID=2791028 RepID=UPI001E515679|nr:LPS export ABC transporter periplasmic protein LptC [Pontibacter sp. 172403-2]